MNRRIQYQHTDDDTRSPTFWPSSPIQRVSANRTEEEEIDESSHGLDGTSSSISVNH